MTNPTTPFSWQMPTASDLVTDLPADFETFGQAVATSMADLLGGTTGQILSKASNTDMDFTWITNDVGDITAVTAGTGLSGGGTSGAVTLSIDTGTTVDLTTAQTLTNKTLTSPVLTTPSISNIDAKGDLLVGTADNTIGRLAVGANNQVLTADSSTATGLKWATAAGGGKVLQMVSFETTTASTKTGTAMTDTNITATITPTASTSKILILSTLACQMYSSGSVNQIGMGFKLLRGSTTIYDNSTGGGNEGWYVTTSYTGYHQMSTLQTINYVDNPSTTSATTYKIQIAASAATTTVKTSDNSRPSTIILMEIGA